MKQVLPFKIFVIILIASGCGCTPRADPDSSSPEAASDGETLDSTLPAKEREALHAGGRALVEEFVRAFSNGDTAAAEAKFVSKKAFDAIVTPGFRGILGSGLLARNQQELANLVDALHGHKVESWKWRPGKLVKSKPQSAFARSLIQIAGGTIELEVDGTFVAVRIDQMVQLDGDWVIFQMHNL